ncbi:MAG: hypothetical protein IPM56_17190 [Ignavibacteriales bacterium]|nr:MAG: hypothetical protein IPM56_17190 [Ignavibacteriales bacterium]
MSTNQTGIFITFLLAMIGYAGMTLVMIISIKKKLSRRFWLVTTLIILSHVLMVWMIHYNWSFTYSIRNGYGGFLIFHSALVIILISNFVNETAAFRLIKIAFVIVTAGAAGAVFRYDVVSYYKVPVIAFACSGLFFLLWSFKGNRSQAKSFHEIDY